MTPIFVYKKLVKGLVPVACLTLSHTTVKVEASEGQVKDVLQVVLARPACVGEWKDDELIEREPRGSEEAVEARLKRFLSRPYFASRTTPEHFTPNSELLVEVA